MYDRTLSCMQKPYMLLNNITPKDWPRSVDRHIEIHESPEAWQLNKLIEILTRKSIIRNFRGCITINAIVLRITPTGKAIREYAYHWF